MIILVSGSGCSVCKMAIQILGKKEIPFKEIDSESERGKELLKAYGAQSLPLLIEDDAHKNIPVIGNEVVKHLMHR